jgi:hypothetical protein
MIDMLDMTEPLFWTPSAIQNVAKAAHASFLSFNNDMARAKDANQLPAGELEAWRLLRDQWAKWYGAAGATTWMFSSNVSIIEGFVGQLNNYRAKYASWTGRPASGGAVDVPHGAEIKVKTEVPPLELDFTPLYWAGGAAALAGVGYLLWQHRGSVSAQAQSYVSKARRRLGVEGLGPLAPRRRRRRR